jgi:glutaredoxin
MKACQDHNESIVVFNGDFCPFCKMEKSFKTLGEEMGKFIGLIEELKMVAKEAGLRFD